MTKHRPISEEVSAAVAAAEEKQAVDMVLLDLGEQTSFTDYFLIASARNTRQSQAIAEEIRLKLSKIGCKAEHMEGYHSGEWILMDYGFMVVHIFSEKARAFYDLERLWRTARRVAMEELR
jgi:ribosome-associated protein